MSIERIPPPGAADVCADRTRTRVLLAEDDDELRAMLAAALRCDGYEVIEVASGNELLRFFSATILNPTRYQVPDVVVSDVCMPGPSGLEVLRGLRQYEWGNPVILITAFGDEAIHSEAEQLGASAVFDKPFDIDELRSLIIATVPPEPVDRAA
jgi:two-component system response regulator (stage 0 sporulation protein F)